MDAREVVNALGGQKAVAEATGSKVSTVVSWEWRGFVPLGQIPALLKLARDLPHCPVTLDVLMGLVEQPAPRQAVKPRSSTTSQAAA